MYHKQAKNRCVYPDEIWINVWTLFWTKSVYDLDGHSDAIGMNVG